MAAFAKAVYDEATVGPEVLGPESGVMLTGSTRVGAALVLVDPQPKAAISDKARLKAYALIATDMQRNNAPMASGNVWVRWRGGDVEELGGWHSATGELKEPPPTALRVAYLPKDVEFDGLPKGSKAAFLVIHAAK